MHVIASSSSGRSGRTLLHDRDNLSSSCCDLLDEWSVEVGIIVDNLSEWDALDRGMVSVWVLGGAMVSPDDNVLDISGGASGSL